MISKYLNIMISFILKQINKNREKIRIMSILIFPQNTSIYKLCTIANTFYKVWYFNHPVLHINHLLHHNFFRTNFDIIHQSIKERLGHEKIQTTLGTYGHLYPNTNLEVAKKLTGILQVQSATESIANYTSNQHTAIYHRTVEEK